MQEKSLLIRLTGDMPIFKVINFLIENKGLDFTKKDVVDGSGISRASLFNYWPDLEKLGIVRVTRRIGKAKLFALNSNNQLMQKILELEKELIRTSMQKARKKIEIAA